MHYHLPSDSVGTFADCADINSLECVGRVYRRFKDKIPRYNDPVVAAWASSELIDTVPYTSAFGIVPKNADMADGSLHKCSRPAREFSDKFVRLFDQAADALDLAFGRYVSGSVFTDFDEAFDSMVPTSSPGYPWNLFCSSKKSYWDFHGDHYASYFQSMCGDSPFPMFLAASIKEEMRPSAKIAVGNVRSVFIVDANHVMMNTQLNSDFDSKLVETVGKHPITLGINFREGGAHWLITSLLKFGFSCLFSADGRNFDFNHCEYTFDLIRQFRVRHYAVSGHISREMYAKMMENHYKSLSISYIVHPDGRILLRPRRGRFGAVLGPSGHGSTSYDNSLLNWCLWFSCWCDLVPAELASYDSFVRFVVIYFNGDDVVGSVDPVVHTYFNPKTISAWFMAEADIDFVFDNPWFVGPSDIKYLGHEFVLVPLPSSFLLATSMWLPVADCSRMRASMLIYNEHVIEPDFAVYTIIRANQLRVETFACMSCREWFASLIQYLRRNFSSALYDTAWTSWKSDSQILSAYTGLMSGTAVLATSGGDDQLDILDRSTLSSFHHLESALLFPESSPLFDMPRTAAQRAARLRRKKAKKSPASTRGGQIKSAVKKLEKETGKIVLTGHGDYVPTRFNRVRGRGGYVQDLAGGLGNMFGGKLGGALGHIGGGLFEGITGMGDYRQRAQAKIEAYKKSGAIDLAPLNMGAMNVQFGGGTAPRVCHREFIGPVFGSASFSTTVYRIQPGLRGVGVLFPWASSVANCFTQYKLHGMVLEYKTTSTNYSSQVGLGSVMMSTQYDAESSPLATQIAVDNNEFTTSDTPATSFIHPIECATDMNPISVRYVQANNSSGGTDDERFNDVGIFQVSTLGQTDSAGLQIGELWASYDIEFLKPALPDIHAGTSYLAAFASNTNGQVIVGPNVTTDIDQRSSYPVKVIVGGSGGGTFLLPVGYAGNYLLQWSWVLNGKPGASLSVPWPQSFGSDITPLKVFSNVSLSSFTSANIGNLNSTGSSATTAYVDYTTISEGDGFQGAFLFSTIADLQDNNYIQLSTGSWSGTGATATNGVYTIIITAVDNDVPSGVLGPNDPALAFQDRRKLRREIVQDVHRVQTLEKSNDVMVARLARLEKLFASLSRVASPVTDVDEPEYGTSTSAPPAKRPALPALDEEKKDSDMDTSIHIPRSLFAKLLPKA
jgi:hypothetical protein